MIPVVVVIKNSVVDELKICEDSEHAETVFRETIKSLWDTSGYTEQTWEILTENGYDESPGNVLTVCLSWGEKLTKGN